jgi:S-DNA-T family DNA segregation ATPase FtsK/SpoIIIE
MWRRIDARSQGRRRAYQQERAWQVQEVLAYVRPELVQYGNPMNCGGRGRNVYVPQVIGVDDGPPETFTVRMLPGQLPADYEQHAMALAYHLGVTRVRVDPVRRTPGTPPLVQLVLLESDPLLDTFPLSTNPLTGPEDMLFLGVDDVGNRYRIRACDLIHLAVQGATGSGKSVFIYALICQLLTMQHILIAISDVSGLLPRPFTGTIHEPYQVSGTSSALRHIDLLHALVDEMDTRLAMLPARQDHVTLSEQCPLLVCVLEEYPGLLRALDDGKRAGGQVETARRLVGRLVSEGRKAGIRLVICANRFEAAVVEAFTREQCTVRLSFRVTTADSIEMLHPGYRQEAELHATAPPGVALFSGPGIPLARIKSPYIGTGDVAAYGAYWDLVTARALPST